jgi:hypothetical protein
LTHEALAKMHFETLGDLDGALAQRCRILANDPRSDQGQYSSSTGDAAGEIRNDASGGLGR